ncbi:hypothetical protein ABPG72_014493, partial [Tetrahymena utriculariae]
MKTSIIFASLTIQLLIIRALDVLPIQINFDVLFIKEQNSIIYQASSDSTYRYSTLDIQGSITATYLLNGLQKINLDVRYFIINNLLYLNYFSSQQYHTIDLNIMNSGKAGYLETLQYPAATYPCQTQIIQQIAGVYYYMCFESFNIFLIQSSTFQDLFNCKNRSVSSFLGMRNEYTHIVLDNQLFMNGSNYKIQISFVQTYNIVLVNMEFNLYLIEDYLTKVQTTNYIFKDVISVKLNILNINTALISDVIHFASISIIAAYDFNKSCFRYFNVQNLQEIQSAGVPLQFINYKTFLQYQNSIFIGTQQYTLTYAVQLNQVNISLNPNMLSNSYTLPYYHIIYYAFSYSLTYQVYKGSTQYLININQAYNCCVPGCLRCSQITSCDTCQSPLYLDNQFQCVSDCPAQFVPDSSSKKCVCRSNSTLQNQSCPCNRAYVDLNGDCFPCPKYCSTCTSQTICSACQAGYYLATDGTCVFVCPINFIPDQANTNCVCRLNSTQLNLQCPCNIGYIEINGSCQQCPQFCDVCTSQTVCFQCSQNYYLTVEGICASPCPQTFIVDSTLKKCVCDTNRALQNLRCVCNIGYIEINGVCQQCPSSCDVCTSQTVCTQCSQNFYLTVLGTCSSPCPQTFIVDSTQKKCVCDSSRILFNNQTCLACDPICKTCNGSNKSQCSSCYIGYILINSECQPEFLIKKSQQPNQIQEYLEQNQEQVNRFQGSSQSVQVSSLALSLLTKQSSSIVLQGIVCLKLSYLILVKTNFPIEENNAMIYLGSDNDWRYSQFDKNGNISQTYILKDMPYFTYCIYILDDGKVFCLLVEDYQYYNFYESNTLKNLLEQPIQYQQYSSQSILTYIKIRQQYSIIGNQISYKSYVYKISEDITIYLIDFKFDIFLTDNKLCLAKFQGKNFSCSKRYDLGISSSLFYKEFIIPKVSLCQGAYLMLGYDQNQKKFIFFDVATLDIINSVGDNLPDMQEIFLDDTRNIIFYKCKIYIQEYFYTISYDQNVKTVNIKLINDSLSYNYYRLGKDPIDNYNPQYEDIIFLYQQDNYFLVNLDTVCPENCLQCSLLNPNICYVCDQEKKLLLWQQKCVQVCPSTFIPDKLNSNCICRPNSIEQAGICECLQNYFQQSDGSCCLVNFFGQDGICQNCPSNCDNCDSQTTCIKCSPQYFLAEDKTCVQICPTNFFGKDSVCKKCPPNCDKCDSVTTCISCLQQYFLAEDKTCVSTCPIYFFGKDGICQKCPSNCDN